MSVHSYTGQYTAHTIAADAFYPEPVVLRFAIVEEK